MNPREAGFLLLGSCLGDPARHPLTPAQLQRLAANIRRQPMPAPRRGGVDPLPSPRPGLHGARGRPDTGPSEGGRPAGPLPPPGRAAADTLPHQGKSPIPSPADHCHGRPRTGGPMVFRKFESAPNPLPLSGGQSGTSRRKPGIRRAAGAEMATQGYTLVSGGAGAQTSKPKRPAWPLAARSLRSWQPPVRRPLIPTSSCAGRIALTCPSPLPGPCPETGSSMP